MPWISAASDRSAAGGPGLFEQRRQQDVLATLQWIGLDAGQSEQPTHGRTDTLSQGAGVEALLFGGAAKDCKTESGRPASLPGV